MMMVLVLKCVPHQDTLDEVDKDGDGMISMKEYLGNSLTGLFISN